VSAGLIVVVPGRAYPRTSSVDAHETGRARAIVIRHACSWTGRGLRRQPIGVTTACTGASTLGAYPAITFAGAAIGTL
jgi:hypothetical protein